MKILVRIFTEDFMQRFGLVGYVDIEYETAVSHHTQRSKPSAKRKVAGFEVVQLAFSKPEQIINILAGRQGRIDSEEDIEATDLTSEGASIFAVSLVDKVVDATLNVAAFKQMLQRYIPELGGAGSYYCSS
jgi:hypothetical protein